MAGTVIADNLQAAATSQLVIKNGVASTPPTIQDSAGTEIGTFCRAWVNFNGTGTVAIRASFNVSSITDNGTGDYTVNFTTAMPNANYSVSLGSGSSANSFPYALLGSPSGSPSLTTSSFKVYGRSTATQTLQDQEFICCSVFS
jgi:hypothetical protein